LDEKRNLGNPDANIYEGDKEWMKLRHQMSREYRKHKQSAKYIELQKKFQHFDGQKIRKQLAVIRTFKSKCYAETFCCCCPILNAIKQILNLY
jgi:hypothetical protein